MKYNKGTTLLHVLYVILLLMDSNWAVARQVACNENLTTKLSRYYLRSFAITHGPPTASPYTPLTKQQTKQGIPIEKDHIKLAKTTQRKVVLRTIFAEVEANLLASNTNLLNHNAWTDLTLFCGASTNPAHHLLSRINRTTTVLGECALATLLVTPTSDIGILSNRQQALKLFLAQSVSLTTCKQSLDHYRKVEPRFLSLWTNTDPLYTKEYRNYMNSRFFSTNPTVNKIARKLNHRIFFRNIRDIYGEFIGLPLVGLLWCESHFLMTSIAKGGFMKANRSDSYVPLPLFTPIWSLGSAVYNYLHTDGKASLLPFLGVAITHGVSIWRGYCGIKHYQEYRSVFRNLATRMQAVQVFLKTIQQFSTTIAQNQPLEAAYAPSLSAIRKLLKMGKESTEIGTMIRNFLELKFDNWSYIHGNGGKLLATYKLFEEYKDSLKPAMYELGKLDAFMGIAALISEAQKAYPEHCYTFTNFLDRTQQKTPSIQFNAMWNPLLNPATVISNEVEMDGSKTRNMILGGPNAGGKSAFLSGVATSLLLSQTFGIAPAKQAIITPFNRINTYIEVGDDIASGASLFMVEIDRMYRYMDMLKNSKPDDFIFTISDEPFSGTNPVEAGATAYSILSAITQYPNALHIVSSHYPILISLADNVKGNGIRNFKVYVAEKTDKKLHYTYKIVPGAADQRVALKLLEAKGYDDALLQQAKKIVRNEAFVSTSLSNTSAK